jgi:hypothetical protein
MGRLFEHFWAAFGHEAFELLQNFWRDVSSVEIENFFPLADGGAKYTWAITLNEELSCTSGETNLRLFFGTAGTCQLFYSAAKKSQ